MKNGQPKSYYKSAFAWLGRHLLDEELKKKSALVKQVCLNGHRIDWESSEILAIESDYKKRRFLESFYIHKTDFSFNDKINSFYPRLYKFINF